MKEPAEERHDGNTQSVLSNRFPLRFLLVSLGCSLLLIGNTLPWPCSPSPDPWPDCYPLIIHDASAALFTAFLVIGILLIALTINLSGSPSDFIVWLILLLVPYLLFIARLRPDTFSGKMYFPLVDVNQDLGGPSFFVMPVSLIVAWLALRPKAFHKKLRKLATISLLALLSLTVYFLVLMGNRSYQITVSSFIEHQGILRTGPLLILAGGIFLLGAEYGGIRRDRKRAVGREGTARVTATHPQQVNKVGFWSALLASASPIMLIVLSLFAIYSPVERRYDVGVYYLFSFFTEGFILLLPISFIVLMACICYYAPPGKKIWARVGLFFAIVFTLVDAIITLSIPPQLYERLATSFPILQRYGALGFLSFAFVSLALLFILPVFNKGGIEVVIRWCFIILGMLTFAGGLDYLLTSARIPVLAGFTSLIGEYLVFPVAMALIAVVFRRAEGEGVERN
jgi:hypothetical protein